MVSVQALSIATESCGELIAIRKSSQDETLHGRFEREPLDQVYSSVSRYNLVDLCCSMEIDRKTWCSQLRKQGIDDGLFESSSSRSGASTFVLSFLSDNKLSDTSRCTGLVSVLRTLNSERNVQISTSVRKRTKSCRRNPYSVSCCSGCVLETVRHLHALSKQDQLPSLPSPHLRRN